MTPQPIKTALVALMTMLVLGCSNYDVSVNERTVYTTEPLFADFDIADPALNQCVSEAVERKKVTSASRLVELNCNARGIENLAGIGVFTGLEQLQLADNAISDISPLVPLSSLDCIRHEPALPHQEATPQRLCCKPSQRSPAKPIRN